MSQTEEAFSVIRIKYPERPTDRYLSAEFEQIKDHNRTITITGVVEITNRWQTAIDVGNQIWSIFLKSYQASNYRSLSAKFEAALKSVNRLLDESENKIVEPINCTLAIFCDGQLYFSTINNGHILMWRRGKLTQITGIHLAGDRFASVTSGELKKNDWLIVGSSELRELFKNADSTSWTEDKPKATLIRELVNEMNPAGYPLLSGITVQPSKEGQVETINLLPPGAPTSSTYFRPTIWLGKIRYLPRRVLIWLASIVKSKKKEPEPINVSNDENVKDSSRPKKRRFPTATFLGGVVVIALLIAGIIIIRNEFRKVSKKPAVATSTIATLISTTSNDQIFPFIEQNLTVDNYKILSDKEKATFTQLLSDRGVTLVPASAQVATTDSPITALANTSNNLYAIDTTGTLWRSQDSITKVVAPTGIQNPISLTALTDNKIVASDQAGQLWLYDGTAAQPTSMPLPAELTQGTKLVRNFGASNLYIYQLSANALYKISGFIRDVFPASQTPVPPGSEPPPPPTPTITSSVMNFGTLSDFVVSGDFIGTTEAGLIKNFTKNKLESLSIQYYQDATAIHLSLTSNKDEFAVARGKFITIYSTVDGHKVNEKALVTDQMISAISAGPGKALYVAAGKNIYKLP